MRTQRFGSFGNALIRRLMRHTRVTTLFQDVHPQPELNPAYLPASEPGSGPAAGGPVVLAKLEDPGSEKPSEAEKITSRGHVSAAPVTYNTGDRIQPRPLISPAPASPAKPPPVEPTPESPSEISSKEWKRLETIFRKHEEKIAKNKAGGTPSEISKLDAQELPVEEAGEESAQTRNVEPAPPPSRSAQPTVDRSDLPRPKATAAEGTERPSPVIQPRASSVAPLDTVPGENKLEAPIVDGPQTVSGPGMRTQRRTLASPTVPTESTHTPGKPEPHTRSKAPPGEGDLRVASRDATSSLLGKEPGADQDIERTSEPGEERPAIPVLESEPEADGTDHSEQERLLTGEHESLESVKPIHPTYQPQPVDNQSADRAEQPSITKPERLVPEGTDTGSLEASPGEHHPDFVPVSMRSESQDRIVDRQQSEGAQDGEKTAASGAVPARGIDTAVQHPGWSTEQETPDPPGVQTQPLPLEAAWPVQRIESVDRVPGTQPAEWGPDVQPSTTTDKLRAEAGEEGKIIRTLEEVRSGKPSDSSIELITPRLSRADAIGLQRKRETPREATIDHSPTTESEPEIQTPDLDESLSTEPGETRLIDTDIGPLPTDLWELVGEAPPSPLKQTAASQPAVDRPPTAETIQGRKEIDTRRKTPPAFTERPGQLEESSLPTLNLSQPVPVQRQPEEGSQETQTEGESVGELDIEQLARKVYTEVKRLISIEKERYRRNH